MYIKFYSSPPKKKDDIIDYGAYHLFGRHDGADKDAY